MRVTPESAVTALEIIRDLRSSSLGESPQTDDAARFDETLQGISLNILERYFMLFERDIPPYLIYGEVIGGFDCGLFSDKSVGLNLTRQLEIKVTNDGHVVLRAPYSGGDDLLLYGVTPILPWVNINVRTGVMLTRVTTEVVARLQNLLTVVQAYYALLAEADSALRDRWSLYGFIPSGEIPEFPGDEIRQIRQVPLSLL